MNISSFIIPPWVKIAIPIVMLGIGFGFGLKTGLGIGDDRLAVYKAKVDSQVAKQEIETAQKIRQNQKALGELDNVYQQSITAIDNYHASQLRKSASKGGASVVHVPPDSQAPVGIACPSGSSLDPDTARRLARALTQIRLMNRYWENLCKTNDCQ